MEQAAELKKMVNVASGGDKATGPAKKTNTSCPVWVHFRFSRDHKRGSANMEKALCTICPKKVVAKMSNRSISQMAIKFFF